MPRVGLFNIFVGFTVLFLAACGGAFIANDMTSAFIQDKALLDSWQLTLLKSAHGHTNLFGLLHIVFGLTLVYSPLSLKWKLGQTAGLLAGTVAMGPGMIFKAMAEPKTNVDGISLVLGFLLTMSLLMLASHSAALGYKLMKRV